MSAKAKAMMERLNKNNAALDNGKPQDLDVIFLTIFFAVTAAA